MWTWNHKNKSWDMNDKAWVVSVGELYPWIKVKAHEEEDPHLPSFAFLGMDI